MPRLFRWDLAGIVAIGSCSSAADPLVRFSTTARTNSRAVSLRDWIRLQFRRKKAFSHMRLYKTQYEWSITGNRGYDSNRVRFSSYVAHIEYDLWIYKEVHNFRHCQIGFRPHSYVKNQIWIRYVHLHLSCTWIDWIFPCQCESYFTEKCKRWTISEVDTFLGQDAVLPGLWFSCRIEVLLLCCHGLFFFVCSVAWPSAPH